MSEIGGAGLVAMSSKASPVSAQPTTTVRPTPVPASVLLAMAQPMLHHRTPEYEALFIEVRAGLKRLFQTAQDVIPFTSSGTGAMEAAVVNTLSPGDTVLVLRAGKFAERWEEICLAYGVRAIALSAPFGETVPADRFAEALARHPETKAVLMQQPDVQASRPMNKLPR